MLYKEATCPIWLFHHLLMELKICFPFVFLQVLTFEDKFKIRSRIDTLTDCQINLVPWLHGLVILSQYHDIIDSRMVVPRAINHFVAGLFPVGEISFCCIFSNIFFFYSKQTFKRLCRDDRPSCFFFLPNVKKFHYIRAYSQHVIFSLIVFKNIFNIIF